MRTPSARPGSAAWALALEQARHQLTGDRAQLLAIAEGTTPRV